MPHTTFKLPTEASSVATGSSTLAWVDPDNVKADDAAVTTLTDNTPWESERLTMTDFRMRLPPDAVIKGIEVEIEITAVAFTPTWAEIQLIIDGTPAGNNENGGAAPSATTQYIGHKFQMWGLTPTVTQIESSQFGIILTVDSGAGATPSIAIDHVAIRVWYNAPSDLVRLTTVDEDAYVKSSDAASVFNSTVLQLDKDAANESRVFIQFDISDIPVGATVSYAALIFPVATVSEYATTVNELVHVQRVTAAWDETTLTWNNQPAVHATIWDVLYEHKPSVVVGAGYLLTALVQAWHDSTYDNYGVRLAYANAAAGAHNHLQYKSQSYSSQNGRPYLVVAIKDAGEVNFGGAINHGTNLNQTENWNKLLLQSGNTASVPSPDVNNLGMIYADTTRSELLMDMGGGWRTIFYADQSTTGGELRTLGAGAKQAAAGNHTH